jgi:hypothetical protein
LHKSTSPHSNMVENKMFYGEQPDFNHIIEQLAFLEKSVNDR